MIKIGIFCPVGPLDRYGYQYNYPITIKTYTGFASRVYLVSTTRNRVHADALISGYPNLVYLSDERTWFKQDEHGVEIFDVAKPVDENANLAARIAKQDGLDCLISMHINQYIPSRVVQQLQRTCEVLIENREPFAWLYRRYQLGNAWFHTDSRLPWIINLHLDEPYLFGIDSLRHPSGTPKFVWEIGDYKSQDHLAVVDCALEMTVQDLADVKNFTRCYSDLNPSISPIFRWPRFYRYYSHKFNGKVLSKELLDQIGEEVVKNSQAHFVSKIILRQYRKPKLLQLGLFLLASTHYATR